MLCAVGPESSSAASPMGGAAAGARLDRGLGGIEGRQLRAKRRFAKLAFGAAGSGLRSFAPVGVIKFIWTGGMGGLVG